MIKFADFDNALDTIQEYRTEGLPKGISTGWANVDPHFTLLKGQLNIVSGFPASGKSEWVENIVCRMASKENWNVVLYSPEAYPTQRHAINLLEKIGGKPAIAKNARLNRLSDTELFDAGYTIKKRIHIVSADEDPYSIDDILNSLTELHEKGRNVDMMVIDPWNELDSFRPNGMSETDYIGNVLMKCRRVARKLNVSFWIVCHPSKPMAKNKSGEYDPPDMYSLAGSAHWYNKADNAIIVHRHDLTSTRVHILIKKIKNRFYGKPGEVRFDFDPANSRYIPVLGEEF